MEKKKDIKNEAGEKGNPYLLEYSGWEKTSIDDPMILYKGVDALFWGLMEDSIRNPGPDVKIIVNAKLSKRAILRIIKKLTDIVADDVLIDQLKVSFNNNAQD